VNEPAVSQRRWPIAIFSAAALVELVLLVKLLQAAGTPGELLGAIIAVVAVMAVVPRVSDLVLLKLPGFEASLREVKEGLQETNEAVKEGLQETNEAVKEGLQETNDRIDVLFALSLSQWQYRNLVKLASGRFGPYVMSLGLENDLRHLRNHGYVEVPSVRDLPKQGDDLSRHVKVTETGHALIRFREALRLPEPELYVQSELLAAYRRGGGRDEPGAET
jgi:hypothetical protein